MLCHYKLKLSHVEGRLVEFKNQEIKFYEKIRGLEFKVECRTDRTKSLTKKLEELKKEKEGLDSKLTGFQSASKDLDNLLESQRSDKNMEGLGYSVVPPLPAQVYSPPKKDMSWTRLPEFADDTITDYSRPSPAIKSNSNDLQNKNPSVTKTGASSSTILSKPAIKFVKAADRLTEIKTNKVETVKKPAAKYAKMYKKTSKSSNVRGNQRNWNNLKSQQLGKNFLMKNKACYNCGEFDHLSYDCDLWVKNEKSSPRNNYTHKSMPPRAVTHKPYRPPMRINRPNINDTQPKRTSVYKPAHSYVSRPVQRKSAVKTQSRVPRVSTVCCCYSKQVNTARPKAVINRRNWVNDVKASACWVWKLLKSNSSSIILKRYDYVDIGGRSMSVMAWVPKKTTEEKVDKSKALDASLVDTESSGTDSKEHDTRSRLGNDAHDDDDDADIRPIYDEEPMAEQYVFSANHDSCLSKLLNEVNSRVKVPSNKTTNRNEPVAQISVPNKQERQTLIGHKFSIKKTSVVQEKTKTLRSCLRWKLTGRIFNIVGLRWVHIGKIFTSSTIKVGSEPPNGSYSDITNQYECEQTLDVCAGTLYRFKEFLTDEQAMTSDHNSSELRIHDHINEQSSSKPVPNVVPLADKTATS
uniref:Ubiquitin hydrolase n=1 Tax=Tanacetum cinerariifolium TaxID=118510 RepID=A0A6L2KJF5_TANCI|nr:ubiquitin hydrolase [Tanacetum cinerariifolium]